MLMNLYNTMISYFSAHVMLNSAVHTLLGFSIALLLQHYLKGHAFIPAKIAWILLVVAIIGHLMPYFS